MRQGGIGTEFNAVRARHFASATVTFFPTRTPLMLLHPGTGGRKAAGTKEWKVEEERGVKREQEKR